MLKNKILSKLICMCTLIIMINLASICVIASNTDIKVEVNPGNYNTIFGDGIGEGEVELSIEAIGALQDGMNLEMGVYQGENYIKKFFPTLEVKLGEGINYQGSTILDYSEDYYLRVRNIKLSQINVSGGNSFYAGEMITIKVMDLSGNVHYLEQKNRNLDGSFIFKFYIDSQNNNYIVKLSGSGREQPYEKIFYINEALKQGLLIRNFNITDASNNPITNLEELERVRVSAEVYNKLAQSQSAVLIASIYDANNKFIMASFSEHKNVSSNVYEQLDLLIDLPKQVDEYYIKTYIWDGVIGIKALSYTKGLSYSSESVSVNSISNLNSSSVAFDYMIGPFDVKPITWIPRNIAMMGIQREVGSVSLSWSSLENATAYKLFAKSDDEEDNAILIGKVTGDTTSTTVDLTELLNSDKYIYVVAYNNLKRIGRTDAFVVDGNLISGTVSLPDGYTATSDIKVNICAWTDNGTPDNWYDDYYANTYSIIPIGKSHAGYIISAIKNNAGFGYVVRYYIEPDEANTSFTQSGYYSNGSITSDINLAQRVDISGNSQGNVDMKLN